MLELILTHGPVPVLLFPHAGPGELAQRTITQFPCNVIVRSPGERNRAGGLVAVWQTVLQRYTWPPPVSGETQSEKRKEGDWEVLETMVKPLREGDFVLNEGEEQTYVFEFSLDSSLPRCRMTPWERVAHTLTIFALAPTPQYSVVPPLRSSFPESPPYSPSLPPQPNRPGSPSSFSSPFAHPPSFDPGRRRSSLLDGLRRLSAGSSKAASIASHDSGGKGSKKGKGKDKEEGGDDYDPDPPPLPILETPFVAETHKEIIVTATPDAPGQVNRLSVEKVLDVQGLGKIHLHAYSDMFIIGGAFMNCVLITDLNPLATLHAYTVTLVQRLISADGKTVHNDKYTLFRQGKSYFLQEGERPLERDIIWRGHMARTLDDAALKAEKKKRPSDDWPVPAPTSRMHLTCGPRLPSSAIGGRPTWDRPEEGFSTIEHSLDFTFFWSIYGMDGRDQPLAKVAQDGIMRATTMKVRPDIGSCSFSPSNVIAPSYSVAAESNGDMEGCMDPFKRGTEPRTFTMVPESWVEKGGKRYRLPSSNYDAKSFDLRQHQIDTDTQCSCFYEDSHPAMEKGYRHQPSVIEGDELDWAMVKPLGPNQDPNWLAHRKKWSDLWWTKHKKDRRAVPGFINFLFTECPCTYTDQVPVSEQRRPSEAFSLKSD